MLLNSANSIRHCVIRYAALCFLGSFVFPGTASAQKRTEVTSEEKMVQSELAIRESDQDASGTSGGSASTSLVASSDAPKLFSLSFENFGIQRTVDGSTITFALNPANLFCATKHGANVVLEHAAARNHQFNCTKFWGRVSLKVSADTSRNAVPKDGDAAETELLSKLEYLSNQISEFSVRVNLVDRRKTERAPSDQRKTPTSIVTSTALKENRDINRILNSSQLTAEYVFQQPDVATEAIGTLVAAGEKPPSLHTARLIYGIGAKSTPFQMTFNFSTTFFSEKKPGMDSLFRDFRAGAEGKWTLKQLENYGNPTLSIGALLTHLYQEPLGFGNILFNDQQIHGTGTIKVAQFKLEFPVADNKVKIPFSLTLSNRTDLIKEKDIRGQIGFTMNFDKLFP